MENSDCRTASIMNIIEKNIFIAKYNVKAGTVPWWRHRFSKDRTKDRSNKNLDMFSTKQAVHFGKISYCLKNLDMIACLDASKKIWEIFLYWWFCRFFWGL